MGEPSSKDKQIQRSSRRREVNWPRLSSANCLVSWNSSELIWKYLPLNINKTSRRIQSSGRGSKRCVLPLEWIPWQVARDSGQICWILETSTTDLVYKLWRSAWQISTKLDDLLRATKKLKKLGTGFTVIPLKSGRYLVQSV